MYTGLSVYFSVSKSVSFDTYFVSTLSVHSVAITDIAAIVYTVGSVMQHMYSVYDIVFWTRRGGRDGEVREGEAELRERQEVKDRDIGRYRLSREERRDLLTLYMYMYCI